MILSNSSGCSSGYAFTTMDRTRKGFVPQLDKWNYVDMDEVARLTLGTVAKEAIFDH